MSEHCLKSKGVRIDGSLMLERSQRDCDLFTALPIEERIPVTPKRPAARPQKRYHPALVFPFLLFNLLVMPIDGLSADLSGSLDPAFQKIPLERWVSESSPSHFRWRIKVWPTILSPLQRLSVRTTIRIDGRDLRLRRGQGDLLMLVQYSDSSGSVHQTHNSVELQKMGIQSQSVDVIWDLDAFVVPGEYRITFAIYLAATGEHSAKQRTLRVRPLNKDPLVNVWYGMPAVEFQGAKEPPERWYQPSLTGHLNLSLETRRRVRIEILLNLSPSELTRSSERTPINGDLDKLIPQLTVLTQIEVSNGVIDASLLDLLNQRVPYEQHDVRKLDWEKVKVALSIASTASIDARSFPDHSKMAQFFVQEVGNRILTESAHNAPVEPLTVLIVLSAPMAFAEPADLRPIEAKADPNLRVYFIRPGSLYQVNDTVEPDPPYFPDEPSMPAPVTPAVQIDYLEGLIRPLTPRVFEARTPLEFRLALGTILDELSRM